jgi:hypothetical protein
MYRSGVAFQFCFLSFAFFNGAGGGGLGRREQSQLNIVIVISPSLQYEETNAGSARWQTREPQIRRELLKASTPFRRRFEEEYFRRPLPSSSS